MALPAVAGGAYAVAVAAHQTKTVRTLFVGDSLLEGYGASSRAGRIPDLWLARQRTRHGSTDTATGPINPTYSVSPETTPWAGNQGTWSDDVTLDASWSMSRRGARLNFDGDGTYDLWSLASPIPFRWLEVTARASTSLASGVWVADMAGPTLVQYLPLNESDTGPGTRYVVDFGSVASRTVAIYQQVTGTNYIEALTFSATHPEQGGFGYADATTTGISSSAVVAGTATWAGVVNTGAHLIIDDLWHNDWLSDAATPAVSASRMRDRIDHYRAVRSDVDIVILMSWDVPAHNSTTPNGLGYTLTQYRTAIRDVIAEKDVHGLDLAVLEPTPNPAWFAADGVHITSAGNAVIADHLDDLVADLLTPLPAVVVGTVQPTPPPGAQVLWMQDLGGGDWTLNIVTGD